jgi:putative FmdB family regulatory protein
MNAALAMSAAFQVGRDPARAMPTYEYACNSCGHRFDVRQSFHDEPIADCPECGASVRRVLYPAGVIFKGSGWYKTDSRKAETGAGSASHSAATSESSSPGDSASGEPKKAEPKSSKAKAPAAADD